MKNFKRMHIVFNLDNPHQRELFEWCMSQSTNFSGFARSVLFAYKERTPSAPVVTHSSDDSSAMADLL
jgi:hypothetical protein